MNPNLKINNEDNLKLNQSMIFNFGNMDISSSNGANGANGANGYNSIFNNDNKFICNFEIQIENDDVFRVTKRIIGNKGLFLKAILFDCCGKFGDYSTKIRLRGRGSGFREGPNHSGKIKFI
jgi:hypothetical protein